MRRNPKKNHTGSKQSDQGSPQPRVRVFFGHAIALGPGKADMLEYIAEDGSISAAARRMGMSYRRAWLLVDTMNHCFRSPLVEKVKGGKGGGGACITDLGREVLRRYRKMESDAMGAVAEEMAALEKLLSLQPPEEPH
jgi:molybdate transport system regulatory protein